MLEYKIYELQETALQGDGLTLERVRYRYPLPDSWATPEEALAHATEHGPSYRDLVVLPTFYLSS